MKARFAVLFAGMFLSGCGGDSSPTAPSRPETVPSAPTISCPASVAASTTGTTAQVAYQAPTVSGGQAPVTVTCTPASGSSFPVGSTNVSCSASDSLNRQATCSFTVSVSRIPTLQLTSFLAFGDSITAGEVSFPVSAGATVDGFQPFTLTVVPSASYPTQLQALLRTRYITQQAAITVANAGVPGETAVRGAQRFPSVMAQTNPQVVLLLQGYNDLNTTAWPGAVAPAAAAIESMAREARARGARVYIASLTPPRGGGRNSLQPEAVATFNNRLRAIATGENAAFVDLYQALVSNVSLYIGVDGMHPTEVGYQRMAETFSAAIQATLQNP